MTDVFIRSYKKDFNWLEYCILSTKKFLSGHRKIIVCVPELDAEYLGDIAEGCCVVTWKPVTENGYIDQQINKLMAYTLTDAENILFVDSDCYFTRKTDISEYFVDGKPFLLKTLYSSVGDAICWKKPTEEILGIKTDFEFMRRIPILLKRSTLLQLDKKIDCVSLSSRKTMSEFNLLGLYAATYQEGEYYIIDTEKQPFPASPVVQGWSWGGLTEGQENKIKEILA